MTIVGSLGFSGQVASRKRQIRRLTMDKLSMFRFAIARSCTRQPKLPRAELFAGIYNPWVPEFSAIPLVDESLDDTEEQMMLLEMVQSQVAALLKSVHNVAPPRVEVLQVFVAASREHLDLVPVRLLVRSRDIK